MIYFLETYTWIGLAPGAGHWYGTIKWDTGPSLEAVHISEDGTGFRVTTEGQIIESAIDWFRTHTKRGNILLKGTYATLDPKQCLVGPRNFKTAANHLFKEAQTTVWKTGKEPKVKNICKRWDKLMASIR